MTTERRRVFLFLQGPPSGFARQISDELDRLGHRTVRINLCSGDWLYWRKPGAVNYRGTLQEFPAFLEDFCRREGVTDVLYYADRLPYHRVAASVARKLGITDVTYEFGYLRPDWITFERGGMSAYSHFPKDPDQIRKIARDAPEPDLEPHYPYTFGQEAFNEVVYNLTTFFARWPFWNYDADKYYNPFIDYLNHLPQLFLGKVHHRNARRVIRKLRKSGQRYYVFPMQLQSDYQLRSNSPFNHQSDAIDMVMKSFKAHAPEDAVLIFKVHPLDNGMEKWPKAIRRLARKNGLKGRVRFINGGALDQLLEKAEGCVLINSTVGLHAYRLACPVKIIGMAMFDIPGLAFQGELDEFWTNGEKPDIDLCADFIKALAATIQVKGNFYTKAGRAAAVRDVAQRLIEGHINEPGAFVNPPPRLAEARKRGLPYRSDEEILAGHIK